MNNTPISYWYINLAIGKTLHIGGFVNKIGGVTTLTYDVKDVSKWFLANNTDAAIPSLNGHLKLQKLLYYAQAMNLAVKDEPLFNNRIEAWENGPVVKDMFIEYRHNNFAERFHTEESNCDEFNKKTLKIFQIVNHVYGSQTGQQLVDLTHSEEPWSELEEEAIKRLNPEIKKERIKDYYEPLKEIFVAYEGYDFSAESVEKINGNVFVYNKHETEFEEDDFRNLWNLGEEFKGEKYFVYKDDDGELVIY